MIKKNHTLVLSLMLSAVSITESNAAMKDLFAALGMTATEEEARKALTTPHHRQVVEALAQSAVVLDPTDRPATLGQVITEREAAPNQPAQQFVEGLGSARPLEALGVPRDRQTPEHKQAFSKVKSMDPNFDPADGNSQRLFESAYFARTQLPSEQFTEAQVRAVEAHRDANRDALPAAIADVAPRVALAEMGVRPTDEALAAFTQLKDDAGPHHVKIPAPTPADINALAHLISERVPDPTQEQFDDVKYLQSKECGIDAPNALQRAGYRDIKARNIFDKPTADQVFANAHILANLGGAADADRINLVARIQAHIMDPNQFDVAAARHIEANFRGEALSDRLIIAVLYLLGDPAGGRRAIIANPTLEQAMATIELRSVLRPGAVAIVRDPTADQIKDAVRLNELKVDLTRDNLDAVDHLTRVMADPYAPADVTAQLIKDVVTLSGAPYNIGNPTRHQLEGLALLRSPEATRLLAEINSKKTTGAPDFTFDTPEVLDAVTHVIEHLPAKYHTATTVIGVYELQQDVGINPSENDYISYVYCTQNNIDAHPHSISAITYLRTNLKIDNPNVEMVDATVFCLMPVANGGLAVANPTPEFIAAAQEALRPILTAYFAAVEAEEKRAKAAGILPAPIPDPVLPRADVDTVLNRKAVAALTPPQQVERARLIALNPLAVPPTIDEIKEGLRLADAATPGPNQIVGANLNQIKESLRITALLARGSVPTVDQITEGLRIHGLAGNPVATLEEINEGLRLANGGTPVANHIDNAELNQIQESLRITRLLAAGAGGSPIVAQITEGLRIHGLVGNPVATLEEINEGLRLADAGTPALNHIDDAELDQIQESLRITRLLAAGAGGSPTVAQITEGLRIRGLAGKPEATLEEIAEGIRLAGLPRADRIRNAFLEEIREGLRLAPLAAAAHAPAPTAAQIREGCRLANPALAADKKQIPNADLDQIAESLRLQTLLPRGDFPTAAQVNEAVRIHALPGNPDGDLDQINEGIRLATATDPHKIPNPTVEQIIASRYVTNLLRAPGAPGGVPTAAQVVEAIRINKLPVAGAGRGHLPTLAEINEGIHLASATPPHQILGATVDQITASLDLKRADPTANPTAAEINAAILTPPQKAEKQRLLRAAPTATITKEQINEGIRLAGLPLADRIANASLEEIREGLRLVPLAAATGAPAPTAEQIREGRRLATDADGAKQIPNASLEEIAESRRLTTAAGVTPTAEQIQEGLRLATDADALKRIPNAFLEEIAESRRLTAAAGGTTPTAEQIREGRRLATAGAPFTLANASIEQITHSIRLRGAATEAQLNEAIRLAKHADPLRRIDNANMDEITESLTLQGAGVGDPTAAAIRAAIAAKAVDPIVAAEKARLTALFVGGPAPHFSDDQLREGIRLHKAGGAGKIKNPSYEEILESLRLRGLLAPAFAADATNPEFATAEQITEGLRINRLAGRNVATLEQINEGLRLASLGRADKIKDASIEQINESLRLRGLLVADATAAAAAAGIAFVDPGFASKDVINEGVRLADPALAADGKQIPNPSIAQIQASLHLTGLLRGAGGGVPTAAQINEAIRFYNLDRGHVVPTLEQVNEGVRLADPALAADGKQILNASVAEINEGIRLGALLARAGEVPTAVQIKEAVRLADPALAADGKQIANASIEQINESLRITRLLPVGEFPRADQIKEGLRIRALPAPGAATPARAGAPAPAVVVPANHAATLQEIADGIRLGDKTVLGHLQDAQRLRDLLRIDASIGQVSAARCLWTTDPRFVPTLEVLGEGERLLRMADRAVQRATTPTNVLTALRLKAARGGAELTKEEFLEVSRLTAMPEFNPAHPGGADITPEEFAADRQLQTPVGGVLVGIGAGPEIDVPNAAEIKAAVLLRTPQLTAAPIPAPKVAQVRAVATPSLSVPMKCAVAWSIQNSGGTVPKAVARVVSIDVGAQSAVVEYVAMDPADLFSRPAEKKRFNPADVTKKDTTVSSGFEVSIDPRDLPAGVVLPLAVDDFIVFSDKVSVKGGDILLFGKDAVKPH
ncbi:MAG: hypothetical protein FJX71_00650 [Alphaproteobacteria bacterium]|nr:hypothetical protein [Alphaproteobacteria bacterium]